MDKLAVIVPYRNRENHLKEFIPHMNKFLSSLPHEFMITIIEQDNSNKFNRGTLINIGFDLVNDECTYISPHDVDLLPESADYSRPEMPTHLAAYRSQSGYNLEYEGFFGGVNLFLNEHFHLINGFSNFYSGYGAEDDDLLMRCIKKGLNYTRRPGRYTSLPHGYENITDDMVQKNKNYYMKTRNNISSMDDDGLSTLKYEFDREQKEGFVHFKVRFEEYSK